MKLGIIATVEEESFKRASIKGLEFIEFCINEGYNIDDFFYKLPQIKEWSERYNVKVGSIGRWKAKILYEDGNINEGELHLAHRLIDACSYLNCNNYVCGCNYCDRLSYYDNCSKAIEVFARLIGHGKYVGVDISTYNCRDGSFVNNPEVWKIVHGHLKDLGIKYDPSHARWEGKDYLKETQEWGSRFYHVHLKGSIVVDGVRVDDPPAGLDQTDWKTFLSILYSKNYDRGLSIEPHSNTWRGELGEKGVDYTIAYMKSLLFK